MEIEAKFSVPNATVLAHLNALQQMAGFSVLPPKVKSLRDCYLDTEDRRIFAHGYALRRRKQDDGDWIISLKGLGGATGAIHRREEVETKLMPQLTEQAPTIWQQSEVYSKLQQMLGTATLDVLFCLSQKRITHRIADAERIVAKMSLDEVHLPLKTAETIFFEMEVELTKDGTEDDLRKIVTFIQENFFLHPETRSKFERALAQLDAPATANRILSPVERTVLTRITDVNARTDTYSRRAQALLAIDEGISGIIAAERAGLSERQVRHWRSEFGKEGVGIFPEHILEKAIYPAPPPTVTITPDAPIGESARKLLWQQYRRMVYFEPAARLGHRPVDISAMLTAVRGTQTAIESLWADFSADAPPDTAPLTELLSLLADLRRTMLWQQHAEAFLRASTSLTLTGLREKWYHLQQSTLNALNDFLDNDTFKQWMEDFSTRLQIPPQKPPTISAKTRWFAPACLYRRLAAALSINPIGNNAPEQIAQLLNNLGQYDDCLALFGEILGRNKKRLEKPVEKLAEHLDALHQRSTIAEGLSRYLQFGMWIVPADAEPVDPPPADATTVAVYSATIAAEISQLQTELTAHWAKFAAEKYWQTVANAVKKL